MTKHSLLVDIAITMNLTLLHHSKCFPDAAASVVPSVKPLLPNQEVMLKTKTIHFLRALRTFHTNTIAASLKCWACLSSVSLRYVHKITIA
jgi:hypothetical protein